MPLRSRVRVKVATALVAPLMACLAEAAPARATTNTQIVQVINAERQANRLPPVRDDPALSAGCAQFDAYRQINGSLEDAFTPHGEEPGRPGYTPAGARAAHDSLLNAGDRVADSFAAGDVFDDAPTHLVALMNPAVAIVGVDQTNFSLGLFGTVHLVCVDVRSAPLRARPRRLHVYLYRGPYGRVPGRHLAYREGPRGQGSLIALYFDAPTRLRVRLRSLTLRDPGGRTQAITSVTASGGLLYAPARARRAANKHVAESPIPSATAPVPGTVEEDPQLRKEREQHEQEVEERRWRENEPTFEDPEIRQYREAHEREAKELEEGLMVRYEAELLGSRGSSPVHTSGGESIR